MELTGKDYLPFWNFNFGMMNYFRERMTSTIPAEVARPKDDEGEAFPGEDVDTTLVYDNYNTVSLYFQFGAGVEYKFKPKYNLFLEGRFTYAFMREESTQYAMLRAGIRYKF